MAISTERARASYADAEPTPFWLDRAGCTVSLLRRSTARATADLAIVGGGYTGLWTAIQAKEEDPGRDVVLVERDTIAFGASGRNGGFCDATLTHGLDNGLTRFPDEIDTDRSGGPRELPGLAETIARHGIECDWVTSGEVGVATEPHQVDWLREAAEHGRARGLDSVVPGSGRGPGQAGLPDVSWPVSGSATDCAMVDPARLAWGLQRVALELGVRIHERTPVTGLARRGRRAVGHAARAASTRGGSCWRRTGSRRWCARSAGTWCPSTTTCS